MYVGRYIRVCMYTLCKHVCVYVPRRKGTKIGCVCVYQESQVCMCKVFLHKLCFGIYWISIIPGHSTFIVNE